jgi:carboxypeptidase T
MNQFTLLSFAILFSCNFFCQTPQTGTSTETTTSVKEAPILYHRARIYYDGPKGILLLANQGLAVDHGHHKFGVYIESDFSENEIQKAKMLGMKVEIQIEDVKKFYVEQNKGIDKSTPSEKNSSCSGSSSVSYPVPANYNHGSMGGFLTLDELYQELDDMAALYPNLISVKAPVSTFLTHENRPLYWVRMSDNPNSDETEPEVLYTAIHHAREPEAMQQLVYYMWYMLENYATNTEVQGILDNTELYFIPMVNPDGYQHNVNNDPNGGGMHRKNKRNVGGSNPGVDNNRNYDYIDGSGNSIWGTSGVSSNTNNDTYPGTGPFSEPENQAIKWFVENHSIKLALNNHTSGDLLLYPYGYANNILTPDNSTYVAISGMMVAENGFSNILSSGLYPAAGDSDDFMYGETSTHDKIFAFTPEIGGTGFWPAVNEIDPIAEGMVYLNLTAAHLVTNYAQTNDLTAAIIPDLSGHFDYDIQRLGLEDPANFTVSIIPISSNILTVGSPNAHNAMTLLQQDNDSISYTLDPAIAAGDLITYVISVDNGQYLSNNTVTKTYGQSQVVFSDAANSLNNWTVSASWNTTTSTFYSASSSITDSPNGDYANNANKSITLSSGVDLNNAVAATLSFYGKWEIEAGYDYVQLEISTNGGNSWIPQCGNYTKAGSANQEQGEPLYDGFQSTWVKEEINLSDYLGQTVIARFTLVSDNWAQEDGFYFDDFEINVVYGPSGIEELTENGLYISQNIPNPANETTTINYILPQTKGNAYLNITNGMGQIIDRILLNNTSQNIQVSTSQLSQGVYYYYIENKDQRSLTKKMIVVKR